MGTVNQIMKLIDEDNIIIKEKKKEKIKIPLYPPVYLSHNKNMIPKKSCSIPWKSKEEYIN